MRVVQPIAFEAESSWGTMKQCVKPYHKSQLQTRRKSSRRKSSTLQFLQGPLRVLGDDRIGVCRHRLQSRDKLLVTAVAHGNGNIALQAGKLRALDRRATKGAPVALFIHLRQPAQVGMKDILPSLEVRCWSPRYVSALVVPRAAVLAD